MGGMDGYTCLWLHLNRPRPYSVGCSAPKLCSPIWLSLVTCGYLEIQLFGHTSHILGAQKHKQRTLPSLQKVILESPALQKGGKWDPQASVLSHLIQLTWFVIFLFCKDQLHLTHVIVEDETNFRFVEFWVICFKVLRRQKDTEQNMTTLTQKRNL